MCGFAALISYGANAPRADSASAQALVRAMHDRMRPRGPDGEGMWTSDDGRVALAHRRLAIIDLSDGGAQPMHSADGRYAIVFNGEIYNYRALAEELSQSGISLSSGSDTEVVLELFARDGAAMLPRLRGMFAIAIWDNADKALFLARDPYGIKPLYYSDDGDCAMAASTVKALLATGEVDTASDPAGHVGFFLLGSVPEPYTLFRGIRAVPAGHWMRIGADGPQAPTEYFSISKAFEAAAADGLDLRTALVDTVDHHMVADVEVGAFLSSGLDSTTLTALAAERGGTMRTVTLGFEEYRGDPHDEVPLAEEVARAYGTRHETRWVRGADFRGDLDVILDAMDQPTIDGVNTYYVSKVTADAGLKVALSGIGGDELFGGYPSFDDIPKLMGRLGMLARIPGLGSGFRAIAAPVVRHFTSPKYAGIVEFAGDAGDAWLLRRALFMPWELTDVLPVELVREGVAALEPRLRLKATSADAGTLRARISALESVWYMRHQLLRDADWAGMAHSLEIRVPLVDSDLLQAVAPSISSSVPPSKRDMALTPTQPLPDSVLTRPKTGFAIPVRDWLDDDDAAQTERGLRGWARKVYARQLEAA